MYKIIFNKKAKKQFYSLDRNIQQRITKAIDKKLAINPQIYLIPLVGNMLGLYKFRVGNYRLLCSRDDNQLCVLIVRIKHRKDAYKTIF